jgi:hypothetical protein
VEGAICPVDGDCLAAFADINPKAVAQERGGGNQKFVAVRNFATDVIGHATVGEGDEFVFFDEDNFGMFVAAAGASGS